MSDETKQPTTCPTCEGKGYLGDYRYCGACYGTGRKDAPEPEDQRAADLQWSKRVYAISRRENKLPRD